MWMSLSHSFLRLNVNVAFTFSECECGIHIRMSHSLKSECHIRMWMWMSHSLNVTECECHIHILMSHSHSRTSLVLTFSIRKRFWREKMLDISARRAESICATYIFWQNCWMIWVMFSGEVCNLLVLFGQFCDLFCHNSCSGLLIFPSF